MFSFREIRQTICALLTQGAQGIDRSHANKNFEYFLRESTRGFSNQDEEGFIELCRNLLKLITKNNRMLFSYNARGSCPLKIWFALWVFPTNHLRNFMWVFFSANTILSYGDCLLYLVNALRDYSLSRMQRRAESECASSGNAICVTYESQGTPILNNLHFDNIH